MRGISVKRDCARHAGQGMLLITRGEAGHGDLPGGSISNEQRCIGRSVHELGPGKMSVVRELAIRTTCSWLLNADLWVEKPILPHRYYRPLSGARRQNIGFSADPESA
jgi:hypothetical protein